MSSNSNTSGSHGTAEHHLHNPSYYVKIWLVLLVLLVISLIGPEIGIKWLTLVTAFGIAIVKAYIVCAKFMHLDIEKKFVLYVLAVMMLAVAMFWFGTVTDINHTKGSNWTKDSSIEHIEQHKDWHDLLEKDH